MSQGKGYQSKGYPNKASSLFAKFPEWRHYCRAVLSQHKWNNKVVSVRVCVLMWKHVTPTNGYHMAEMPRSTRYYERGNLVLFHFIFFPSGRERGGQGKREKGKDCSYRGIRPLILVYACGWLTEVLCLLDFNINLYSSTFH